MTDLDKIKLLNEADRKLAFMRYHEQRTIVEIAHLCGLSWTQTQRRCSSLQKHWESREFNFIAENLKTLPRHMQAAADARYLKRMSQRNTAIKMGVNASNILAMDRAIEIVIRYIDYHTP